MFRITRGIHIQHGPAYPSPALRFPDGMPIPVHAETDAAEVPAPVAQPGTGAGVPGSSDRPG